VLRCRSLLALPLFSWSLAPTAGAIVVQPFTASGTYLRAPLDPPSFQVGSGGFVEELDGFLALSGQDLNGAAPGTTAQLSIDALPASLSLAFHSTLSADQTDLLLRYDFTNTSASPLPGVGFLSFLDVEIDETLNTFFNEYGETAGSPAAGQGWEIDEPGFVFGDIFDHLLAGSLDGTNSVPVASPDDVSLALSFGLGVLAPGQVARFEVLISEDGDALGGFVLRQHDMDPASASVVTYSLAASIVPEPGTALLLGVGLLGLGMKMRGQGA